MKDFNQFLKNELNSPQQQAVTHKEGPVIVIAGAGSGKTRVITTRIANLIINENESPKSIVALTFTNKAAGEMKNRLINFLGAKYELPFVGTFHSYCLLLLKTNRSLLPFPEFSILDADDQVSLLKKIIKKNGLEKQFSATELSYQISNLKNKLQSPFDSNPFSHPLFKEIYLSYETEKAASHSLDFDDLILEVLKIFKEKETFRKNFQDKIKHLLVDEYQDTNLVQHELLKYMSLNSKEKFNLKSICAVGDEDQSIYSWRGAMATNMLKFQKNFAPVTLIKIEQNYRSVQPILDAANSLINYNKHRTPKQLWSNKKATDRILKINCGSGYQEADTIATFISCLPKNKTLNNIAILYRTHFQSRNIEEALIRNSIAYKIIGGIRFYERKEIKDILAYLRLIINPFDRTSLFRIINCPQRGLGEKFEELLYTKWIQNNLLNFEQLLEFLLNDSKEKVTGSKAESVNQFLDIFKNLNKEQKVSSIVEQIIEKTDYMNYLQKTFDQKEAETKGDNIREFVQSVYNFENNIKQKNNSELITATSENKPTLETFLEEISLMQEKMTNKEDIENEVQCMTLHAAKGLEFDTVILTGLEEGLLPSSRSLNSNESLEEERRLFYVGITRAQERAVILNAETRNSFGQVNDQVPSRFLDEIPMELIKNIDITDSTRSQIEESLDKWLGNKVKKTVFTFQDFAKNTAIQTGSKKITPAEKAPDKITKSKWLQNKLVSHKKFGPGIIKKVEKKDSKDYYITAIFKSGEKKILSSFLELL